MIKKIKYIALTGMLAINILKLDAQSLYDVTPLEFNTRSKEMAPAFFKNGLVFVSDKRNDLITTYTDYQTNPLTNLYFTARKRHGKFDVPRLLAKELTTFMFEGPATFSRDGKEVYFTRSIDVSTSNRNRSKQDTTFGIFHARIANGNWTGITPFGFNSNAYNTGYPYLSDDGASLFFCSDAPGGSGGFDIYMCTMVNGTWSDPVNLGSEVNTSKNEVFPFFQSGKLYFASRGHKQQNDLDIYLSSLIDGKWQKPVALQEPFNTPDDDYGLIFSASADTGYFVSDRNGSADLFGAYSTLPVFTECSAQRENDYCYAFYESSADIDTSLYAYEWDMGDGTLIRAIQAEHCFARPDTYLVQLNVIDKLTKEVMMSQATYSFVVEKIEQPYIMSPDTLLSGQVNGFSARETYLKDFVADNYYWDFGDGSRAHGIDARHEYNLPGIYHVKLGVTGKSESSGDAIVSHCVIKTIVVKRTEN